VFSFIQICQIAIRTTTHNFFLIFLKQSWQNKQKRQKNYELMSELQSDKFV